MGLKEFWREWYKEEQRRDKRLVGALQRLGIYEQNDFEPIRDEVERQIIQSEINRAIEANPEIAKSYTNKDRGIKASAVVDQWYDHGTNQEDINKAIQRVGEQASRETHKESKAKEIIRAFMSEGYFGYLLLRRLIGKPLEHPVLRPWYAGELMRMTSLINPGGKITLLEGTYTLSDQIDINKSNVALTGVGYEATKICGAIPSDAEYIHFSGGINNILISDLYVDGSSHPDYSAAGTFRSCIGTSTTGNLDRIRIERVKIYSTANKIGCIHIQNDTGTVKHLTVENCYLHVVAPHAYGLAKRKQGENTIIYGNTIIQDNTDGYNACAVYQATEGAIVADNIISGNGHTPVAFSPAHHGVIANNVVYGTSSSNEGGIEVECSSDHGSGTSYYVAVIGNTVHPVSGTGNWGIYLYDRDGCGDPHHNVIIGNVVEGFSVGIYLHDGEHNIVAHNILYNNTTALTDNGSNNYVKNNLGYNPVGVSSITVGASPFTYTAGSSPETVYIRGGTVSAIKKGDTTLFTDTGHSVELEPHESVTVEYSAAPTMYKDVH